MKKLLTIAVIMLFSIFTVVAVTGEKVSENQPLEIVWVPDNSNFARIGFSSAPVNSVAENPSKANAEILKLDSIARVDNSLQASNKTPLYAYCQFYGNQVCYVDLSVGYLTNVENQDMKIPIDVKYNNLVVSSGEDVNAFFSYDTTKAVYVDSVELDVSAVLPDIDNLPSVSYSGNITLELRFQ